MFPIKQKRQFALNKLFNLLVIIGIFLGWISVELFVDKDIAWAAGCGIAALLLLILPSLFTPCCYIFDSEGVSLRYLLLPVERYLWKDIHAIEVICTSTKPHPFDFFYAYVFSLHGRNVGKSRFYMNGHIRKSFRTKHLLETYWDGTITGYVFEDIKKWMDKRKSKKQAHIKAHFTDEIVPMEREIRAEVRTWLAPFVERARQDGLEIKTNYSYITKDWKKFRSRPKEGYTYTLVAEIAPPHETDENRITVAHIDLLYVRLGKTAYRGVKNEHAKEELEFTFSDALRCVKD